MKVMIYSPVQSTLKLEFDFVTLSTNLCSSNTNTNVYYNTEM